MSSPPDNLCKTNNRMSPTGISMFYCSLNKKVCIEEVVDTNDFSRPYYTTSYFKSKSELNLVDLTHLPPIPSIYDEINNKYIDTIFFLEEFIKDIAKAVTPSDSSIEYVPTQIVTEYIKFNPALKADGIIYPSSKAKSQENIVLFKNQDESLEDLTFYPKSLATTKII